MESFNDTLGGIDDVSSGGGGGNESFSDVSATTESEFFIEPPDDPSLVHCISFVLKSDIKVRRREGARPSPTQGREQSPK